MEFEWDPVKSDDNFAKHGVSFEHAQAIWADVHVEITSLARSNDGESRNATMGRIGSKLYVAIWTMRHGKIRLISVRRSRPNEEKTFMAKVQDRA
ncbi:MAG: BrnT family toxin [Deltaproteobacteria bacterium]|nr:BrnT family toxin [Deltaproteobacteria bacterium]